MLRRQLQPPELTYRVIPKNKPYDQLLAFLRARPRTEASSIASRASHRARAANLAEDA